MPAGSAVRQAGGDSCWRRIKMGFMMGAGIGLVSGALFGGFSSWRAGLRGYEFLQMTSKSMVQGGGTFGTFMAIGSGIRC